MPDTKNLINDRECLPSQFSLENYADAEQLDAYGWAMAFAGRENFQWVIEYVDQNFHIDDLFKDPLFKDPQSPMSWALDIPKHPIKYITVGKAQRFGMTLDKFDQRHQKELAEIYRDNDFESLSKAATTYHATVLDSIHGSSLNTEEIYLTVDITCSDQLLISQFQEVLTSARTSKGITRAKQTYSQADFDRWHKYGVLPFIDLTLWANTNNVKISQHLMGDVLFPDVIEDDTTQIIRQTVKPLAQKVLKVELLNTLWAQSGRVKKG